MRRFASRHGRLESLGSGDGHAYRFEGLGNKPVRGMYRVSLRFAPGKAPRRWRISYDSADHPGQSGRCVVLSSLTKRDGRDIVAEIILPEAADELKLFADRPIGSATFSIRRLSSTMRNASHAVLAVSRRLMPPRELPRRLRLAQRTWRKQGFHGLRQLVLRAERADRERGDWAAAYEAWLEAQWECGEHDACRVAAPGGGLFLFVVHLETEGLAGIRRLIAALRAQHLPNWRLYVVPGGSLRDPLELPNGDERVTVRTFEAEAEFAAGDFGGAQWIGFLDSGDWLPPNALCRLSKAIGAFPDGRLFYSDEDAIDEDGGLVRVDFKPDWNREYFHSRHSLGRLAICHESLLRDQAAGESGISGIDLAFRVSERDGDAAIVHVSEILCRRRTNESTAGQGGSSNLPRYHKLPAKPPLVSIIIPTRDMLPLLEKCVRSILDRTQYPAFEILIVDNDSRTEATRRWLADIAGDPRVTVMEHPGEFNFSAMNNRAASRAKGDYLAFVNNDVEVVDGGWLSEMTSICIREEVGAVGPKLLFPDGSLQHAGYVLNETDVARHFYRMFEGSARRFLSPGRLDLRQRVSAVIGACLLTPSAAFAELGGFDEECLPVNYNDIDYCLRLNEAGFQVIYTPRASLIHHEGASRGYAATPEKSRRLYEDMALMKSRWGKWLARDPWAMPGLPEDFEP